MRDSSNPAQRLAAANFSDLDVLVTGSCMEPLIEDGARVAVRRQRTYFPGDVVVVPGRGGLLAHRLLGWRRLDGTWCLVTAGDHSKTIDDPVPQSQVLGRVRSGDCDRATCRVPLGHRIAAGWRFFEQGLAALRRRRSP